jgi:hypothetical protein
MRRAAAIAFATTAMMGAAGCGGDDSAVPTTTVSSSSTPSNTATAVDPTPANISPFADAVVRLNSKGYKVHQENGKGYNPPADYALEATKDGATYRAAIFPTGGEAKQAASAFHLDQFGASAAVETNGRVLYVGTIEETQELPDFAGFVSLTRPSD